VEESKVKCVMKRGVVSSKQQMTSPYDEKSKLLDDDNQDVMASLPSPSSPSPSSSSSSFVRWNGDSLFGAQGRVYRFSALLLICLLTFGSYFSYDIPASISTSLEAFFAIGDSQYALLYSVYSWPNTLMVFIGGVLIDQYLGVRVGAVLFSGLVCAGQVLFWFAGASQKFWLAIVGRVVFGLGGESLGVAQSAYTAKFFRGKELAFAFGIALSFARIGSAVNLNIEPVIVKAHGVPFGLFVGALLCGASLVAAVVLGLQDRFAENRRKKLAGPAAVAAAAAAADPPPKISDIRFFSLSIWLIYFICVTFYIGVFVLIQFASQFVQHRYAVNEADAGTILSLPYLVSAGASPVLGFLVDRTGRAVWWISFATVLLAVAQFSFFLLPGERVLSLSPPLF
jgi:MFS family permease